MTENDELAKTYTYDAFNRLSTYTADGVTASYTYDGDNLRQSKTVNGSTVNHLLDGANVVADIYPDSTNIYVYGNGVELFKTGGQTSRYTKSYRGDVTAVTTGDTKTEYFYDAFGNKQTDTDTSTNPFEYCGEYFDDETGLIYLRNRYYDPTIGRFITEDPARDGENWYVYAGNNPVNFVDADGLADRFWVDLGKGWKACIDSENVQNGTQRHVHIVKGSKSYSQNDDGSPHDKNKNSRGKPPKSVLKNLKKKMKWDYEKKEKNFFESATYEYIDTELVITYPNGYSLRIGYNPMRPAYGISTSEIKNYYYDYVPDLATTSNNIYVVPMTFSVTLPSISPAYVPAY